MKRLSKVEVGKFQKQILDFYDQNRRSFTWREEITEYGVFVSEIMLQQTQASRVEAFYQRFISRFPDFEALSKANTGELLKMWKGLGYNRRALNIREAAGIISQRFHGKLPTTPEEVDSLPGIGPATACSILVFARNIPLVFIETNIRRVYLQHFFPEAQDGSVEDGELFPLIEQTVFHVKPRDWFYALMDYGAYLKKEHGNANRKSRTYSKQSAFEGSRRQVRGWIIDRLLEKGRIKVSMALIREAAKRFPQRKRDIPDIVDELVKEGFISSDRGYIKFHENIPKKD